MATNMGTSGLSLALSMKVVAKKAETPVANTVATTHCHLIFSMAISDQARNNPKKPVMYHL